MNIPSLLLSLTLLAILSGCSRHEERPVKTAPPKSSAPLTNLVATQVQELQRQMAALEARCRSAQNTQQAVQFYKEMFWVTYRENIYPTYRLLQDKAIATALARDPSLQSYANELRRSTEETYLALQATNWQKMAEIQKQRTANHRNPQFMDQARRYLAMQDSFITVETLPLHEKMTDDVCNFLVKLHPDMAQTIRLEYDLQISKLRLQLQINQVLAKGETAQASTPGARIPPGAYRKPRPAQAETRIERGNCPSGSRFPTHLESALIAGMHSFVFGSRKLRLKKGKKRMKSIRKPCWHPRPSVVMAGMFMLFCLWLAFRVAGGSSAARETRGDVVVLDDGHLDYAISNGWWIAGRNHLFV